MVIKRVVTRREFVLGSAQGDEVCGIELRPERDALGACPRDVRKGDVAASKAGVVLWGVVPWEATDHTAQFGCGAFAIRGSDVRLRSRLGKYF